MNAMFLLAALPVAATLPALLVSAPDPPARPMPSAEAPPTGCPDLRPRFADGAPPISPGVGDRTRPVPPRTLDKLPPGRLELSVLREVDGCAIPAVLREGIGGAPEPERR